MDDVINMCQGTQEHTHKIKILFSRAQGPALKKKKKVHYQSMYRVVLWPFTEKSVSPSAKEVFVSSFESAHVFLVSALVLVGGCGCGTQFHAGLAHFSQRASLFKSIKCSPNFQPWSVSDTIAWEVR